MARASWIPLTTFALLVAATITRLDAATTTCSGQKLDNKFEHCLDLPHLGAYLHYTYNIANTSIAVAFIAKPAKDSGWIAWGINPTSTRMVGTQAFVAYKVNGVVEAKTFNVAGTSPAQVIQSTLSFQSWDLSAKSFSSSGEYVIYGKAKVPKSSQKSMNHVWQVGPSVSGDALGVHALDNDNLKAWGSILLGANSTASPGGANSTSPATSPGGANSTSPAASPGGASSTSPKASPAPGSSSGRVGVEMSLVLGAFLALCTLVFF